MISGDGKINSAGSGILKAFAGFNIDFFLLLELEADMDLEDSPEKSLDGTMTY